MAKNQSFRHKSNRNYQPNQQVKGYYRNVPINTTFDRRRQRNVSSSSSSASSLSSINWTENLGSHPSNNPVPFTLSPPSSIELSPSGSCGSSSLKSSSATAWNDLKNDLLIDEIKVPVKRLKVEFDTPRFSVSKENQLPFLDIHSNQDNWREFKALEGVCKGDLRARVPLINALLPMNRDLTVRNLYSIKQSIQCSVCGIRFALSKRNTDYALHLDFHYLSKSQFSKKCQSGSWYPSISSLLESDQDFKSDDNLNRIFQKKETDNALPAWSCEIKNCELCLEPFEQEYRHGDIEGWYIVNAIQTLSGGMVHPGCQ